MGLYLLLARSRLRVTYTSRLLQALIKIYSLVDCPIYSVVKYRPHQLALTAPPERDWIVSNPIFGAKNHSLSWRPTLSRTSSSSVRGLNLRNSFIAAMARRPAGTEASKNHFPIGKPPANITTMPIAKISPPTPTTG